MRLFILMAMILFAGQPAGAGSLSMSLDSNGLGDCVLSHDSGPITMYVIHWASTDVSGVRYRISTCQSTLTWLSDTFPPGFGVAGDSQSGVDVQYSGCLGGPITVQSLAFFGSGDSPTDSGIKVLPHPASQSGQVEGDLCDGGVEFLVAGGACIKPVYCFCNYLGPVHNIPCLTVPVAQSTWGRVKAMYR